MTDVGRRTRILAIAAALAVPAEGLRQVYYYDPPGILTVCYGSTTDVDKAKVYTLSECKARLDQDMLTAVAAVERCAPGAPEGVSAAFADTVYNVGPKVACDTKTSTAARMLAAKDYVGACNQLPRWDKARVAGLTIALPGLTKRRAAAQKVCLA